MTDVPPPPPILHARPRWWPLCAIIGLELVWLLWVWSGPAIQRQQQVLKTAGGLLVGGALLLIWLLAFSRLRWKTRLISLLLLALPFVGGAALFRVRGVTGDLIPVLVPRWRYVPAQASATAKSHNDQPPEGFAGFTQFLGPNRDGTIPGPALARSWQAEPPSLLWRVGVGEGFAGTAISGNKVVSLEQLGDKETVVCRDLFSGATLWSHEDPVRFENSVGGIGPRTTPAISGDHVFAVGATGHLRCLDLSSGKLVWAHDILKDAGAPVPSWGVSGSPLIMGDFVVVHPGGAGHSVAAYHIASGEVAWSGGNARAGYSSPQPVTLLGEPQILIFNGDGVTSHAPANGNVLWTYPWNQAVQHVSDPRVVSPSSFVVSTGYGAGADLVELSRDESGGWKTFRRWHTQRLKSKFGSLIVHQERLYGLDDGRLTCIDLATGDPLWKGERVGHGQLLLSGDLLVVSAESGDVLLLDTQSEGKEIARFAALSGKMWNPPALASPFLVVRTESEMACYRLPVTK